jgi:ribonucleoside-diphosphate reductase alpha chain
MELENWVQTDLQKDIWKYKYRFENESLDDFFERVAESSVKDEIKQMMIDKKFLAGGRILANKGLQKLGKRVTFSNCYVIEPPEDNIESIFDAGKKLARTYSYGGGCGIDIDKLAPTDALVNNAAKNSSGAVSFMDLYSLITGLIAQKGRRGALMISIGDKHPDLLKFIDLKSDLNKVTKANISIRITNEFMKAAKENKKWKLEFYREETGEKIEKEINARKVLNQLAKMNWDYAEPGALFWDRINNWTLLSNAVKKAIFKFAGVNPCAEEPLPAGGSCLIGSHNLSAYVKNPFTENAYFDFDEFEKDVKTTTIYLNDVLDEGLPLHPLEEQRISVRDWRQIGLGVMGKAETFIKLGIRYGGQESLDLVDKIGRTMINASMQQSALLAKEFGTYPKYDNDVMETPFFESNANEETRKLVEQYGLRNSQLLTIAPTGSLSSMLGISGGVEPIFMLSYFRKTESLHNEEKVYKVYTPIVEEYMNAKGIEKEEDLPDIFITAMTLNYKERIDMQSIWQKYIDASISSTVNVPNDFTIEQVEGLYIYAWEKGLKGVTIFRDGCKRAGILTSDGGKKEEKPRDTQPPKRPKRLSGFTEKVKFPIGDKVGKAYITINVDEENQPYEVFIEANDIEIKALAEKVGRLATQFLRYGNTRNNLEQVVKHLRKGEPMNSLPSIVARLLEQIAYGKIEVAHAQSNKAKQPMLAECPDCKENTFNLAECVCHNCGYSKCN